MKEEPLWVQKFNDFINNTPKEELQRMMDSLPDFEGPTVEEYFDGLSGHPKRVAELEARIAELEAENERLNNRLKAYEHERNGYGLL